MTMQVQLWAPSDSNFQQPPADPLLWVPSTMMLALESLIDDSMSQRRPARADEPANGGS